MKIGIYTIHACNNFGAILQAYATVTFIRQLGYDAELVNITTHEAEKGFRYIGKWNSLKGIISNVLSLLDFRIKKKSKNFSEFRKKMPMSKRYFSFAEYESHSIPYDVHLVGSDQVWNVENGLGDKFFFLPFIPSKMYKASFASSFGNIAAAKVYKEEIKQLLQSFSCICVREEDACVFLREECKLEAANVLDPTFLLSSKEWDNVSSQRRIVDEPYILYYGFDRGAEVGAILKSARRQTGIRIVGVSVTTHSPYSFDLFYQEAGPAEFLNLIRNASLVITSSFHGMALSLNYRKDFIVIKNGTRMSRMESLLFQVELSDRIITSEVELGRLINAHIDYTNCEELINAKVELSKNYLSDLLEKSK